MTQLYSDEIDVDKLGSQRVAELLASQIEDPPATQMEESPATQMEESPASQIEEGQASPIAEVQTSQNAELPASQIEEPPASQIEVSPAPQIEEPPATQIVEPLASQIEEPQIEQPQVPWAGYNLSQTYQNLEPNTSIAAHYISSMSAADFALSGAIQVQQIYRGLAAKWNHSWRSPGSSEVEQQVNDSLAEVFDAIPTSTQMDPVVSSPLGSMPVTEGAHSSSSRDIELALLASTLALPTLATQVAELPASQESDCVLLEPDGDAAGGPLRWNNYIGFFCRGCQTRFEESSPIGTQLWKVTPRCTFSNHGDNDS